MKKLLIFIIALAAGRMATAQSSYDYINAVCNRIITMDNDMTKRFKDTLVIRRVETGVLSQSGEGLQASTQRTLYSGKTYLLYVFTDRRVPDLKMNVYSQSNGLWQLLQTVNKNENRNSASDNMYGDWEIYAMSPDTTQEYKVEIAAPAGNAAAARYGMIIWSKELKNDQASSGSSGSNQSSSGSGGGSTIASGTYFSTDRRKTCYWDPNDKVYKNCQEEDAATLFVLNANKTMFKHTTDKMSSTYYVQNKVYKEDKKSTHYEVVSDAGNKYTFIVPDDGSTLMIWCDKGNDSYYINYTIRRRWSE
jgi:hypothetical protein